MSEFENTDIQPAAEEVAAEQSVESTDDRPNWLPSNFKTPEALVESYREAQKHMTQISQENSELRQQIGIYEANQVLPDVTLYEGGGWTDDEEAQTLTAQAETDPRAFLSREQQIAALQEAAIRAVDSRFTQPPTPQSTEAIVNAAKNLAATASPDLEAHMPLITQEIQANPDLGLAVQTAATQGDSASLASLLLIAERTGRERVLAEKEHAVAIRAKEQAQTATGQGPARITSGNADAEEWAKIVGARPTTEYWRK